MPYNKEIFLTFMTINPTSPQTASSPTNHRGVLLKIAGVDLGLFLVFYALLFWLWLKLPLEGVKLHGTVDIGVDLLGTKNDLSWFGVFGISVFALNLFLAYAMAKKEKIASLYLVVATGLIFILLIGTVFFLMNLNRIF